MRLIEEPYFLAVCVPTKIDRNGVRWCTELWAKDLERHLEYISNLTLASPLTLGEPSDTDRRLDVAPFDRIRYLDLPSSRSYAAALLSLPKMIGRMWRGINQSSIVHAGFGGWPLSEGLFAIPIGRLQGRFVISYVESSFWRTSTPNAPLRHRLRALVLEWLNRFCVRISDLRFFTSKAYEREFLGEDERAHENSYVTPATWIDENIMLSEAEAEEVWNGKKGPVHLLYAGRLISEKGISVLLEAMRRINSDADLEVTILGDGPFAQQCAEFVQGIKGSGLRATMRPAIPYGAQFFELIRSFDAVVIPSISDEQPRLIFDAFSQALPVIGSDTGGILEIVEHDITGKTTRCGDATALSYALEWAADNRETLRSMGFAALRKCYRFTHRAMHEQRSEIIWWNRRNVRYKRSS